MPYPEWTIVVLTLGLLLGASLLAGLLAESLHLPRVTAYLLTGLLLGPSILEVIPKEQLELLDPLAKLAMALVLFSMGCHFPLSHFRRILRRVLRLSAGELGLTFLLVTGGLYFFGVTWQVGVLLGALALATAPATTILVLKETESEGPLTEYTTALVALNNFAAILFFELLFLFVHFVEGKLTLPISSQLGQLAMDVAGSISLGIAGGLVISYACGLLAFDSWFVALVAVTTAVLGTCQWLTIPYLLAFLAMGMTVANASEFAGRIVGELDRMTGLLCVVFFVVHGAELNLAALVQAGWVGAGYVVLRFCGKYFGIYFVAGASHEERPVRTWLGAALVSQAGAAIALSAIATQRDPALGEYLQTIILGTVVVFEIAGPILIRQAVLHSGEIPVAHVIHHTATTPLEQFQAVWNRLLIAVGRDPRQRQTPTEATVQQFMRKNVQGIPLSATFDEVVEFIERSHDNTYPVVGELGELAGVIRYEDLRNELFDMDLAGLVRAEDLTVAPRQTLFPDDPVSRAWDRFRRTRDDCIAVVSREKPHKHLGVLRRRDILRFFFRGGQN